MTVKRQPRAASGVGVEVVVALPFALRVDVDVLSKKTDGQIGSISAQVVLPRLTALSDGRPSIDAPHIQSVQPDIDWAAYLQHSSPWGTIASYQLDDGRQPTKITAQLHRVLLKAPVAGSAKSRRKRTQVIADEIAEHVGDWISLIGDWYEVTTGSYLERSRSLSVENLTVEPELNRWSYDGTKVHTLARMRKTDGVVIGQRPLDSASWARILLKANKRITPPIEHLLLRDSRGSLLRGDTRRAVLDAATAAEISLFMLLDTHIGASSEPIKKIVREANYDMGRLARTLRKLFNVDIRPDLQKDLAERRHQAIHAGPEPSRNTATVALDIAAEVVDLSSPRAALLSRP